MNHSEPVNANQVFAMPIMNYSQPVTIQLVVQEE